jgi:hypothetical protein
VRLWLAFTALALTVLAGVGLGLGAAHISGEQLAYSGPQAAVCLPQHLNASDLLPHTSVAVSPLPGSRDASPETQISFLGVPARKLLHITVFGSITGSHSGRLERYSQGDGGSFVLSRPFHPGERVTVRGSVRTGHRLRSFSYHFFVAYPDPIPPPSATPSKTPPAGSVQSFRSAPGLEPPTIEVLRQSPRQAPGDIFLAPYLGPGSTGPAIVNQQGQLIWMDPLKGAMRATNLQLETYEGKPVLTWWQGYIPKQGFGLGEEIVANDSYEPILHLEAGNGELADLHDFHLEPDHTAVLTIFHTIHCNLTSVDGPRDAAVTDASFQELDVRTGLVRREWTSLDHVALDESYSSPMNSSTAWPFDFFHINTVDPRPSGTTLISSRNTSALWLLNTRTGQVIEKIGGKRSSVTMLPGSRTAFQHDAMTLPSGDISIFDNGGTPFDRSFSHTHSRGVVVDVSATRHTDRPVRESDHSPPLKAGSQGDVELLPDGNWFVGWGQEPYFAEYNAEGKLIYEARMSVPRGYETQSYRTYKFPWNARPHWPPAIVTEPAGSGLTVYVSWNGATGVRSWEVIGGTSSSHMRLLAHARSAGFQTILHVRDQPYLQAVALDRAGKLIGRSRLVKG